MTSTIISIIALGISITLISVWWLKTTLKKGRKSIEEIQNDNL